MPSQLGTVIYDGRERPLFFDPINSLAVQCPGNMSNEEPYDTGSGLLSAQLYSLLDLQAYLFRKQIETSEHMSARKVEL